MSYVVHFVDYFILKTLKYWVGVQWAQSYLMGRRCDDVMIKMPYGVDFLHQPTMQPIFHIGLVKTESGFIVR